ncbi:MAG: hypothetical protein OXD49_04780 [Candidatus Poribacteria bacterium]|nr:hypothetical protein [Candidatus Poribacteria bacterium]
MNSPERLTTAIARKLVRQKFQGQTLVRTAEIITHVEKLHCEGVRKLSENEKIIVSDALASLRRKGQATNSERRGYWSFHDSNPAGTAGEPTNSTRACENINATRENTYMEVVNSSSTKYPNREALTRALDLYLNAMLLFVCKCLDEQIIRDELQLSPDNDLRDNMEVKDIAALMRRRWNCFQKEFRVTDRHSETRYYDARSVTHLIVEGRNRVSHQRLKDLDHEYTRTRLSLIAEILGEINRPNVQREVETLRDDLFDC